MVGRSFGPKYPVVAFVAGGALCLVIAGYLFLPQTETYRVNTTTRKYLPGENQWEEYVLHRGKVITRNGNIVFAIKDHVRIFVYDLIREENDLLLGALVHSRGRIHLVLYNVTAGRFILVKEMTAYRPWNLQLFDADGDGAIEVCLGVYKKSPLHPVEARRLFLYTFTQGTLRPKWLGSRLAHPFTDFAFTAGEEGPSLFAIELDKDRRPRLSRYRWEAFGFTKQRDYPGILPPKAAFTYGYRPGDRQRRLLLKHGKKILKEVK